MKKIIKPIQPIKPSPPTKNKPKNSSIKKPSNLNKWLFIIIKILFLFQKKYF